MTQRADKKQRRRKESLAEATHLENDTPLGSPRAFDLAAFVPYQLSVLSNLISASIAEFYDERYGLSVAQWRVIAVLARFAPLSAAQVCERTAMDKVAVSRAVTTLKTRRLITRTIDSLDGRRSVLRLTASGERVHNEIAPVAQSYEMQLLADLRPEQRQIFMDVLNVLHAKARDLAVDQSWRD
jgi:DNA-binding MarR family transcriptional regulator